MAQVVGKTKEVLGNRSIGPFQPRQMVSAIADVLCRYAAEVPKEISQ